MEQIPGSESTKGNAVTHDLDELAARVEAATKADRNLDRSIQAALDCYRHARRYTGSLDAAASLVPEGWHVGGLYDQFYTRKWHATIAQLPSANQLRAFDAGKTFGVESEHGEGATAPLALTAVCLRVRASLTRSLGGG